jgi:lysophospholipase L1-like esterase
MITNSDAIRVLCFGDSNTYGMPDTDDDWTEAVFRWPSDVRWPGRLQNLLGPGFEIIEEGRCGRTVEMESPDVIGADGRAYFVPCLHSHNPLDIVVIMLGTNDIQVHYRRTSDEITASIGRLINDVDAYAAGRDGTTPRVIVVAPIPVTLREGTTSYNADSVRKSHELRLALHVLAADRNALFVDAGAAGPAGVDGVHLGRETHARIADLMAEKIRGIG